MIKAQGISYSYKQNNTSIQAITDINLDILPSTTCAIIGPSGCGKTTLLYILGGLLKPEEGTVLINGSPPTGKRKDIAIILQEYGLLPWNTVLENVTLGLKIRGLNTAHYKDRVNAILEEMEIKNQIDKYPSQLSGGQRQRVAIARSLTLQPDLLLMDEPFSSLDALTREHIQNVFLNLWKKYQMTSVFVTHSIEEAVFLGQKIIVLSSGPGRITEQLENSHFAREDWRSSSSFFEQCQKVRSILKAGV